MAHQITSILTYGNAQNQALFYFSFRRDEFFLPIFGAKTTKTIKMQFIGLS